uniref:Uncharacterized protein n=1 Tax=Romanomermis culicivorax TaxID=13658 RepID=A0A915JFC0_ROMCU
MCHSRTAVSCSQAIAAHMYTAVSLADGCVLPRLAASHLQTGPLTITLGLQVYYRLVQQHLIAYEDKRMLHYISRIYTRCINVVYSVTMFYRLTWTSFVIHRWNLQAEFRSYGNQFDRYRIEGVVAKQRKSLQITCIFLKGSKGFFLIKNMDVPMASPFQPYDWQILRGLAMTGDFL